MINTRTWTRGLPKSKFQDPKVAKTFWHLLQFGFLKDPGSLNTIQYCHRQGWIYSTTITNNEVVYVLPSPLHRAYFEWKLLPSSTPLPFSTLLDMSIAAVQAFQQSQLSDPPQRVGDTGNFSNIPFK
jgi:hypothetical protein